MSEEEIRTHALVMATAMKVVCGDVFWEEELFHLSSFLDERATKATDADVAHDLERLSDELFTLYARERKKR